ncbi:SPOR domain-containing protein [Aliiroseovarius sediminis]|uniref:SPOR domain-containing protein n=1 Tax=Aliiroseovarius sediminis TaxID=2925839 RepID=UPI001F59BA95|nr:SPOR domain-containing protein [Aliiroseovarius sediminis]MCI2394585.1 SPOR domain-containing protein [Aliiroseovarius sediminis]
MASKTTLKVAMALGSALILTGCDDTNLPAFMKNGNKEAASSTRASKAGQAGERDVEAPEIFQVAEKGLWDGRPSLGGVWVAHPDATDPERVIIRNQSNNKSVVGALFRRERAVPGPRFQVSSDAASTLGMLAGAPVELSVTALRKEEIIETPDDAPDDTDETTGAIEQSTLDDPIAAAKTALDKAEATQSAKPRKTPAAQPAPAPKQTALSKPYIQIGIFSVEGNAQRTVDEMQKAGMAAILKPGSSNEKTFWRVLVGPANTKAEQSALREKVVGLGFTDAYAVTN